jgi:hypothetical protein
MKRINASLFCCGHHINCVEASSDSSNQCRIANKRLNAGIASKQLVGCHERISD